MRIVSFSNTYHPTVSGVITSMDVFRKGLLAAGHHVHLIAPETNGYRDTEPYIYRLPSVDLPGELNFSLTLPFKNRISILMEGIKPDIIHCQHPFLTGQLAASFASDLDIPLVYTFHSRYDIITKRYVPIIADIANQVMEDYMSGFFQKCSLIIAPTPTIREFILETYHPKAPVEVLPTPINTDIYCGEKQVEELRTQLGLSPGPVLLYIGRLAREKNTDFLIRVFAHVAGALSDVRLVMVGDGPERERLSALSNELGVDSRIIITGFVPHQQIKCYAALGDLFVFPSDSETQGLVLLEAMASGLPAVAAHAPGCDDILAHGGGVLLPLEEETFAKAIVDLLTDKEQCQAMGEQATRVASMFDVHQTTQKLVDLYDKTIDQYNLLKPAKNSG